MKAVVALCLLLLVCAVATEAKKAVSFLRFRNFFQLTC